MFSLIRTAARYAYAALVEFVRVEMECDFFGEEIE